MKKAGDLFTHKMINSNAWQKNCLFYEFMDY